MAPHSQLLIAAVAVGGAIVLAVGLLLGDPFGLPDGRNGADPTLARVTVLELEITPARNSSPGDPDTR